MTAQLAPTPVFKGWSNDGQPLAYGLLTTFEAGTTIKQAAYTDSTQSMPLPNPVRLDFRGETPLWLDPTLVYKFVLTDFFGNMIPNYPVDNIPGGFGAGGISLNLIPTPTNTYTLGNSSHSWAQLYLGPGESPAYDAITGNIAYFAQTTTEQTAGVVPVDYGYSPGVINRYGINTNPGSTDMLAAIDAAITAANVGNFPVIALAQTYFHSNVITMKPKVSIRGAGKAATTFLSSHLGDGIKTTSAINSTSGVFTEIRDCRFKNTNGANIGGAIVDVGGTEVSIHSVRCEGFDYHVIFDQTELGDIDLCDFENFLTGGVWLVNGADHTPGANQNYTNRISVTRCQFNGAAGPSSTAQGVGIYDDGGVAHSYRDNNFNLCVNHMRIAGDTVAGPGTTAIIEGNEFEGASGPIIIVTNVSSVSATPVGEVSQLLLDGNFISPTNASSFISMSVAASSLISLRVSNNRFITSTATIIGTATINSVYAFGNQDSNVGTIFDNPAASQHWEQAVGKSSIVVKGNITSANALGLNGEPAPGVNSGWGTPTGATTLNNFPGGSATLAQTSGVVAEIIAALQAFGLFGT